MRRTGLSVGIGISICAAISGLLPLGNTKAQAVDPAVTYEEIPSALKESAIATRSDKNGQIAGARIPDSDYYVVYIKTQRGCGSGGCRAQIWQKEGSAFIQKTSLSVGSLPITIMPQEKGMPMLGVTTYENETTQIMTHEFRDEEYSAGQTVPESRGGAPLITQAMLRNF